MEPEQCAVGPDGQLLPAEEISLFDDPNNVRPISQASTLSALSLLYQSISSTSLASSTSSSNLNDFCASHTPMAIVARVHQTKHVSCPSSCLIKLQNAAASTSHLSGKCKTDTLLEIPAANNTSNPIATNSDVDSVPLKQLCLEPNAGVNPSNMDDDKDYPDLVDVDSDNKDEEDLNEDRGNSEGDGEGDEDAEGDDDKEEEEEEAGDEAEEIEEAYLQTKRHGDANHNVSTFFLFNKHLSTNQP